jgi:hypothetical protein
MGVVYVPGAVQEKLEPTNIWQELYLADWPQIA